MNRLGHLAGLTFATIFGFSFLFSKIALNYVSPVGLIAYRFLIGFIGFELLRRFKVVHIRFEKKYVKLWFAVAFFQPILYFLFETYGLSYTTSGEAGMMIALIPIIVSILGAIILKEAPRKSQYFFILLSVLGIVFIQIMKPSQSSGVFIGFLLLFLAVVSAGLYNIASRNASKQIKPYEVTYFMMLVGAVGFNIIYLIQLAFGDGLKTYVTNLGQMELILPLLYLGIIASIGGFFMMNFALSRLPAHVSSVYSNLSTIVAIIAGALILREQLFWYHYVGSIMIIVGVYGTVRLNQINRQNEEVSPL